MAGRGGKTKSGRSSRAQKSDGPAVEVLSEENTSDDLPEHPSKRGQKRSRPATRGGVSSRTRARKAVSYGNEPVGDDAVEEESPRVQKESAPMRDTNVASFSLDTESEDMSAAVSSKTIHSVLVPTVDEQTLLARIIDPEPEYHREGSKSDRWNHWLNVKQKKIWWKELYESDIAARVFTKKKDKEKVMIEAGSSSNVGMESILKGLEERMVKVMEEGFSGINLTVDTKLEAMYWTLDELEKSQRVLKAKYKKIEKRLASIEEEKGHEDVEFRQDQNEQGQEDKKDKENSEKSEEKKKKNKKKKNKKEDKENSEKGEEKKKKNKRKRSKKKKE
ncbi:hypothetical protein Rs2_28822 [Raphanus sativus]|nr:hypothetical protein Rs2_28822 [Raphanus sativus]